MPYDVPHAVSPSLWVLAGKRLLADRVAMVSLAIVAAFLLMMLLSGTGLIAKDWSREVGVNYAPPSFAGADAESAAPAPAAPAAGAPSSDASGEIPVVDPLADALAGVRRQDPGQSGSGFGPSGAQLARLTVLGNCLAAASLMIGISIVRRKKKR